MSTARFDVAADIRRASTIDVSVYDDPSVYRTALERVFAPSWQLLPPPLFMAPPARGARAATVLDGALDEPVVVTFDGAERRVLSNVCTHRGAPLVEDECDERVLVCPYHGRSFGLDGEMRGCPGFEGALDFPRPSENLARLPLRELGPLAFTAVGAAPDFEAWAAPIALILREYEGLTLAFDPTRSVDYTVEASWALYCENYLEGFHIGCVHPGLSAGLTRERYRTEVLPRAVRQLAYADKAVAPLARGASDGLVAEYLWLFPNLMVNSYAFGLSINVVEPLGPTRCRVRYWTFVARPEFLGTGVGGNLGQVELEDQRIVEAVARGVRSRHYPGGRFSPEEETGPHHFHRMLAEALDGGEEA